MGRSSFRTRSTFPHWALKSLTSAQSFTELQQLLLDPKTDSELRSIAVDEIDDSSQALQKLSTQLKTSLLPVHEFAHLPCLLELRPGAGGSEAALFVGDLLRMYQAFCKRHNLRASILKLDQTESVGSEPEIQEAILEIESEGSYGILRCEAGVHRVQRVPATEQKGRTHTSAVSVLVLPSFPDNGSDSMGENSFDDPASDFYIEPKDVRTDVMRARGAGGQHVNTTDSAVRLTHIPTNTVVNMQDNRSQQKNRAKAWQILRSRIAQARREAREEERAQLRSSIAGAGKSGRGDKIRTYNWGQQRVTDHRSGITLHNLDDILEGGIGLDEVMQSVRTWLTEKDLEGLAADEETALLGKKSKPKS
jgi:peptide chain release factor 1